MTWWNAAPELLLGVAWMLLPGIAFAGALRLRGLVVAFVAPPVSVGMLAGWGVILDLIGVRWTRASVLAAVVVTVVAAYGLRRLVEVRAARTAARHGRGVISHPQDRLPTTLTAVGAMVGTAFAVAPVAGAMGRPDLPAQFWDVVFHLNATRYVLDSGSASSLYLGAVNDQVSQGFAFYPAGWHSMASMITVDSVVISSNVMVLATVMAFVLGVAALARAVLPGNRYLGLFASLAAAASMSFPASFTVGGGIWPSLLSVALVPAAVAAGVMVLRRQQPQRAAWVLVTIAALGGVATAQPSGALTFATVLTPFVLARAGGVVMDRVRSVGLAGLARWLPGAAAVAGAVGWCGLWLVVWRVFAGTVHDDTWRGTQGFWTGVLDGVRDSPGLQEGASGLIHSGMVVLLVSGVVVALATRGARWLVPALAGLLLLVGISEASNSLLWVAMPWFAGPNRLLGGVPVVSTLLTGLTLSGLVTGAVWVLRRNRRTAARADAGRDAAQMPRPEHCRLAGVAIATVVAVAFVGVTDGLRAGERTTRNAAPYTGMLALPDGNIADADELAMIERLRGRLEPGVSMIGDPFRGFGLAYAISDVPVVFAHLGGRWSPEARFLARNLYRIHEDPEVCAALDRLNVGYLYTDEVVYLPWHGGRAQFDGIPVDPPQPGFELIEQGGRARVWRITACGA